MDFLSLLLPFKARLILSAHVSMYIPGNRVRHFDKIDSLVVCMTDDHQVFCIHYIKTVSNLTGWSGDGYMFGNLFECQEK